MENKTVYEQYKKAMLEFYNRMSREGYKENVTYTPLIKKNGTELLIRTNSLPDRLHPQGVTFRYDSITKDLLVELGQQGVEVDETTGLKKVRERLSLLYHSDGTMNVTHFSESNLHSTEKEEDDVLKREAMAMISYGRNVPGVSFDDLINETDLLDSIDTEYFEKLHRGLIFQAPEFDIDAQQMKEEESSEPEL